MRTHERLQRKWEGGCLNVQNMEQKIIFLTEMQGQLSDGMWENTQPYDHWVPWGLLTWDTVHVDLKNAGVQGVLGRAPKRNYRFNSTFLLDVVGDRIILKINLWKTRGDDFLKVLEKYPSLIPDDGKVPTHSGDYWDEKRAKLEELGLTEEVMQKVITEGPYTFKDLRKDCAALTKVFKMDAQDS